jgi:hypothetical protein
MLAGQNVELFRKTYGSRRSSRFTTLWPFRWLRRWTSAHRSFAVAIFSMMPTLCDCAKWL